MRLRDNVTIYVFFFPFVTQFRCKKKKNSTIFMVPRNILYSNKIWLNIIIVFFFSV